MSESYGHAANVLRALERQERRFREDAESTASEKERRIFEELADEQAQRAAKKRAYIEREFGVRAQGGEG